MSFDNVAKAIIVFPVPWGRDMKTFLFLWIRIYSKRPSPMVLGDSLGCILLSAHNHSCLGFRNSQTEFFDRNLINTLF
jgi:hypothetical protein